MTAKRLLNKIKTPVLLLGLSLPLFIGCQQESIYDEPYHSGEPRLDFKGTVWADVPATRALTQSPVNIEPTEFDGYFYVQVNDPTYKATPESQEVNSSKFGYYRVPLDGNGGVLEYIGNLADKPNWFNVDDDHYFWSWTLPWTEAAAKDGVEVPTWGNDTDSSGIVTTTRGDGDESDGDGDGDDNGDDNGDGDDDDTPVYTPVNPEQYLSTRPIRIKLKDTNATEFRYVNTTEEKDSSWQAGSWGNGYFFEKFIGAKSGPYDFRRNGVEVPLQFRHLMSKIAIRTLTFQRADGVKEEDLKANITFINMPTEFTFYPHPNAQDVLDNPTNTYIREDGPPIVVTNFDSADPRGGIMYGFTNPIDLLPEVDMADKVQYRDKFYICPEVDFSNVSFMVEFLDGYHMSRGEYYGDFSSVAFERDPNLTPDYDNGGDVGSDSEGKYVDDTKVLHAGETMYFDLLVREFGGGGYTIYVRDWSNAPYQQTKHYPHPGIYVDGEATELIGTSQTWEAKFDLYGDGFLDNKNTPATPELPDHLGVFHQYNDLDMGNRTSFTIDAKYVYNGMGHILKFSPSSDTKTVTIGKLIDVYIEINGSTVYIDPEGWICTMNPTTGKFEKTDKQIDLKANKSSFTLNVETGELS